MKRLELLDYARFVAAISVLMFHYLYKGIHNGKISSISYLPNIIDFAKYGYLGVELFFMISGYVIFFSAKNKTASEFVVVRAIRLYPAFWVSVVFTASFAQLWGGSQMSVEIPQVIANLTMVPGLLGQEYVDGVYWTLQKELYFYLLVFFCLLVGRQSKLERIFILWPFVLLVASVAGIQNLPYIGGYYCFFAAGSVLAILKDHPSIRATVSLMVCLYLCVAFSTGNVNHGSEIDGNGYSIVVIGFIVFFFFLFFLFANSKWGSNLTIPGSTLAGGLTYPLYLIHANFGYMFISRFATEQNKTLIYILAIALVFLVSYLIHTIVEKRCARVWRGLFSCTLGAIVESVSKNIRRGSQRV